MREPEPFMIAGIISNSDEAYLIEDITRVAVYMNRIHQIVEDSKRGNEIDPDRIHPELPTHS